MTPNQRFCLDAIEEKNRLLFADWFKPEDVMAIIGGDEDRDWDLHPPSRWEPRLSERSYGVMQVLASTARQFGFWGTPEELTEPSLSIEYGMRFLRWGWRYLSRNLDREPSEEEWIGGYNAGYAAALQGRWVRAYVERWGAARDSWRRRIGAAQGRGK